MSASSQDWTASDLRLALVKKAAKRAGVGAPPETLSAPTRKLSITLADYIFYYDSSDPEVADDIKDDKMYQLMMTRLETLTAHDAVRSGDISSMRAVAGRQGEARTDVSQKKWLDVVKELIKPGDRDHMLNMITYAPPPPEGPTGVGKTDFKYTFIESALFFKDYSVATSNESDPYTTVHSWADFKYWLRNVDGPKIAMLDELSQELMYSDMNEGKALSNLTKLGRKYNCHILGIGHTGKDIPKDVRRMYLFALKEDKKSAVIGAGLSEDPQTGWMEVENVLHRLKNIPETTTDYKSYTDTGEFDFSITSQSKVRPELKREIDGSKASCRVEGCNQSITDENSFCANHGFQDIDIGIVLNEIVQHSDELNW